MNKYIACPKCKRKDSMEHRGKGFFYCMWIDCLHVVHISKYEAPKIDLNRHKKFRDIIKKKNVK